MDVAALLEQLEHSGQKLEHSARYAGLHTSVPTCPGWTVSRLVGHVHRVHAWSRTIISGGDGDAFEYRRPDDADLLSAYRTGLDELVRALRSAPDSLDVWTIYPGATARLAWARRQAHETAIHLMDAEAAAGLGFTEFGPDFAADGLAELALQIVDRFEVSGLPRSYQITFTPIDSNRAWTVTLRREGASGVERALDGSDLTVLAPVSNLYRWAWNRANDDDVSFSGDLSVIDVWHDRCQLKARRRD